MPAHLIAALVTLCLLLSTRGAGAADDAAARHLQFCLARHFDMSEASGQLLYQRCVADPNAGRAPVEAPGQTDAARHRQFCLSRHFDMSEAAGLLMYQRCMADPNAGL